MNIYNYNTTAKQHGWILKSALILALILISILASIPPICRDSLTHHLYIPKLYIKYGGIYEIPYSPFSYYPQILDLLYMIPLYFKNDIIPKYIHFSFAIITAVFIYLYLKERFDKQAGFIGSLFFLTIPVIVKLSITVYVDLGLICFTFLSIVYLFKWKNSGLKWLYLVIAGVFTGLAMSTKYNGILTLFLLTLLLPFLLPEEKKKSLKSFLYPVVFVFTALTVFSPWVIKNYIWTGNPFYPVNLTNIKLVKKDNLLNRDEQINTAKQIFSDGSDEEVDENIEKRKENQTDKRAVNNEKKSMNHFLIRKHIYHEKWWETLLIPFRIFFQGEDDNPALFDGKLNPFLFIAPLFLLFYYFINRKRVLVESAVKKKSIEKTPINESIINESISGRPLIESIIVDKEILFLILFSTIYVMLVFLKTDMRIRYISPIIPPLVIAYAASLYKIKDYLYSLYNLPDKLSSYKNIINPLIMAFFLLTIFSHISYIKALFLHYKPLEYISGKVSKSEYINKFRPEYELIQYLNKTSSSKNSKTAALFLGNRGYYFDGEVRFHNELLDLFKNNSTNETELNNKKGHLNNNENLSNNIALKLNDENFTHIIVGFDLLKWWIQNNLTQEECSALKYFFDTKTLLIKQNKFYGLYQLK